MCVWRLWAPPSQHFPPPNTRRLVRSGLLTHPSLASRMPEWWEPPPSHLAAAAFNALQPVGVAAAGGFNNGPSWKAAPTMPARDDPFDFDHIVSGLTPSEVASLLADVGDNL